MNSNDGRPTGSGTQDDYEATVLDFLNQEMASVEQAKKPKQQSDELDALVSDLLQQVITETGQLPDADMPPFDQDELFVGLTPGSGDPATPLENPPPPPEPSIAASSKEVALPEAESAMANPEMAPEVAAARPKETAIFGSSTVTTPRRFPVKIAAAFAGLILVIGAAAYYFWSNSGKSRASRAPVAEATKSEFPTAPVASPPVSTPEAKQQARAPVVKTREAQAPKPERIPPAKQHAQPDIQSPSVKPSAAESKSEPIPATPVHEEKIPAPQPPPSTPVPAQSAPVIEKPSPPPVAEPSAPVVPERKPVPAPPASSATKEPAAPSPTPAPATPPVSGNLIPAVPISQASPEFPALALRTRTSGQVVMELQIDKQGKVVKARAVSGPVIFYNAAITAAMKWRYRPASINGVNVPSQSKVTMSFNLKE